MARVRAGGRRRSASHAAGAAIAAIALAHPGCAAWSSTRETVTGWFGAGSSRDEAAAARRKPRRAPADAAAAPDAAAPEGASSGTDVPTGSSDATETPEASAAPEEDVPPEAPEKSIFDPY